MKFSVADRDEIARTAEKLGAKVFLTHETPWTREAFLEDPQGARFSVSEFSRPRDVGCAPGRNPWQG